MNAKVFFLQRPNEYRPTFHIQKQRYRKVGSARPHARPFSTQFHESLLSKILSSDSPSSQKIQEIHFSSILTFGCCECLSVNKNPIQLDGNLIRHFHVCFF